MKKRKCGHYCTFLLNPICLSSVGHKATAMFVCLGLPVCLPACMPVCRSVCLSVCLSVRVNSAMTVQCQVVFGQPSFWYILYMKNTVYCLYIMNNVSLFSCTYRHKILRKEYQLTTRSTGTVCLG